MCAADPYILQVLKGSYLEWADQLDPDCQARVKKAFKAGKVTERAEDDNAYIQNKEKLRREAALIAEEVRLMSM
jgi:hypothetical protein